MNWKIWGPGIALVLLIAAWVGRYEVSAPNQQGVYTRHDRWTQTTERCGVYIENPITREYERGCQTD